MGTVRRRLLVLAVVLALPAVAPPAYAEVSVSRAELRGSELRLEGTASPNRDITVDGTRMGTSDGSGRFKIARTGYTPPPDCTVDVDDGSRTPRTATLSGCTVSTPPPTASPVITPDVAALGPGYVGSDFTTFSDTTTTLTFGPDALGPVHFEVVAGQLPAGLQLLDQNDGSSPNKAVSASITGTPTTAQTTTFTVRATDANGLTATRSYSITVNPARTLEITPQPWAPLKVGEFSNLWVEGSGGVRPYTWTRSAGQLPPGMSLVQDNPDGPLVRITGTPTTAGTFTFTLRLADAELSTVSRTFTVTVPEPDASTGPAAPTLLAPADGASVTTPFTIDWTEEFDPSLSANGGYNYQVSTSSTFSTFVLRDSTLPSVTEATVSGLAAGTYFWRVQAVDGQLRSSAFSAPSSFTVTGTTTAQPGTAVLRLPAYGDSFHPFETFELFWTTAERAAKYELLVSKDSGFQTGNIRLDNIAGTSTGVTIGDFCGGCEQGTYFARVVAIDADGNRGLPSNTVSFTISYQAPLPPPPAPVAPADGATVSLPFVLDWADVPNPQSSGYEVQVSRNASFTELEDPIPFQTASQVTVLSMSGGTKFWRVRSAQGNDAPDSPALTDWSAVRTFTIPSGAPAVQSVWLGAPPCQDPCPGADSLSSGQEIAGSVQLTSEAGPDGAVVSLTADKPAAAGTFPATVTVPAGSAFAGFRLFAGDVTEPTVVTLTATLGSSSDTFVFTVNPTTVKRLSFCCDSTGGLPAAAHLDLTGKAPPGGMTVSLSSSSPLADPPATVDIPAGAFSTPISIPTSEVSATTTVTISATSNGTTVTAPLELHPQQPPTSIALEAAETTGTEGASGLVRIATAQDHEVLMRLTSSNPAVAKTPAYAQIPVFGTVGPFTVTTQPPATSTQVTITATGAGVSVSTVLTVHPVGGPTPGPSASALSLSPSTVTGGATSTGTVTLSASAPAGGASVTLASSVTAAATVPASVTVPAGATTASFTVTSRAVSASTTTTISAAYGGATRSAVLTVNPSSTADTVSIQRAQYDGGKRVLEVEATSTSATATLRVFVTATGALIGTLTSSGGGRYRGQLSVGSNPQNITVTSSLGGTATRAVTLK